MRFKILSQIKDKIELNEVLQFGFRYRLRFHRSDKCIIPTFTCYVPIFLSDSTIPILYVHIVVIY